MKTEEIKLSSSVTISTYKDFETNKNREKIAGFIWDRFSERYILPLRHKKTHGFSIMAISCLMIEALESFWQGWPNTIHLSKKAFCSFFARCQCIPSPLGTFCSISNDFYEGVRCALLHQAETSNGWRIQRKGQLYDPNMKMINAIKFQKELENVLRYYCDTLRDSEWDSTVWENLRKKMTAIIENCSLKAKPHKE